MRLFGTVDNVTESSIGGWVCVQDCIIEDDEHQIQVSLFSGDTHIAKAVATTQRDDLNGLGGFARAFSIQIEKSCWNSLDLSSLLFQANFREEACQLSIWHPLNLSLQGNSLSATEHRFYEIFNSRLNEHLTEVFCPYLYGGVVFSQNSILPCCEVGGDSSVSMPELISDLKQKQFKAFSADDCKKAIAFIDESRRNLIDLFKQGKIAKCHNCIRMERRRRTEIPPISTINMINFAHFTNCQLKCTYCYTNNLAHAEYATYDVFAFVNRLIKLGHVSDEAEIVWTGGEPTIQRHFGKMLSLFEFVKHKQLIASNCLHFSKDLQNLLLARKAKLICSLDAGTPVQYAIIHRKDCFEKVVQNLVKYLSTGGDVVLKYVLVDANADNQSIDDFLQLTKQIGGKEVFIVPDFARVPEKDKYLPAYANFTDKAVELGLLPTMACVNEEFRNKVMRFSK